MPFNNEEANVTDLYDRLKAVMETVAEPFELVFVDDGSTDRTFYFLREIAAVDSRVVVIKLGRKFGQTSALAAGFDHARGEYLIAMDGDLQHDPADIPRFVEKIREGFDIVSGWRKRRIDNLWLRRVPSLCANWFMAKLSGVDIHDFGTTFKAYRRELIHQVPLYGELHRFIPALASFYGARIVEVPIRNAPRASGGSHYGLGRTFHVLFDILTVQFLLKYFTRPMHFFGKLGLFGTISGGTILAFLLVEKIFGHDIIAEHGPLMMAGGLLLLAGLMMFSTGLLGEVMIRTYFESQGRRIYAVREIRTRREPQVTDGAR